MSNQNTKKSPGIEVAPFYCKEDIEMDNCGCLNISLSLFYFYFVTNLQKKKKLWHTHAYSWASPRATTLLAAPPVAPPLSLNILWMTPQCNVTEIYWIKLLTRLRLGLNHLREHKFRRNFQDTINPPPCS